jgi:hypothetical protein
MSSGAVVTLKEIAMAKSKVRAAARRKSTKRGKASVKPARKKTVKRATARRAARKQAKAKVRRPAKRPVKPTAKEMGPLQEVAAKQPSETTVVVAAIEQPTPAPVVVAEAVRVTASPSPEVKREEGHRPTGDLDVASNAGEMPEQKVA